MLEYNQILDTNTILVHLQLIDELELVRKVDCPQFSMVHWMTLVTRYLLTSLVEREVNNKWRLL